MRRVFALVLPLLVVVAACGDSESSSDTTAGADTTVATSDGPTNTLAKPDVEIPSALPTELVVTDLVEGSGPEAAEGDTVVVHYVGVRSADGTEFDNSYDRGEPFSVTLGAGSVIPGWEQGLVGVQQGTRRQLDIPSDLAYGDSPQGDVIQAGDALTFVIDVVAVLATSDAADQPDVTVEGAGNIDAIESEDLVVGEGASPAEGDTVAVQVMIFRADTGELLNSSWGTPPATFTYAAESDTYPGVLGVVKDMKVGGLRQSQVPFAQIFDGAGNETLGLPASIDVVIVMELVAVF
jgi:peptidylprolyl isomerase